uniref:uncharacterized protein LOC105352707 n=1 Tax=Fragaria vesca subsp. vesca TaxID=101020 RepID=UPI0005CB41FC|nr:PREDICTED: uncharacterized protein LOC105352707 [Fragaria vesca subsp. vesca]
MGETDHGYTRCELKLDTSSKGWHMTMIKVLNSIKGVKYYIDAQAGIAYVAGTIHPDTVLRRLAKSGKHATLLKADSGGYRQQVLKDQKSTSSTSYGYGYGPNQLKTSSSSSYDYGSNYNNYGGDSSYGHQLLNRSYDQIENQSAMVSNRYYDADTQCTIM